MPNRHRFKATPRPDPEVVSLLERALKGARLGHVKTISLVLVDQSNQIEGKAAGDLSEHRINALLAGLARCTHGLLTTAGTPPQP